MSEEVKVIKVPGSITVDELATALGITVTALIGSLFKNGIVATINQKLDFETASIIVEELGMKDVRLERKDTATQAATGRTTQLSADAVERPPIVAVMGHVDHGKTTLLDTLLKKKTVESESGGITQHISAYQMKYQDRSITFLDTPGHEAFAAIRQHGAQLTDIVVLVVAADDGVKPQTGEAIKFARDANAKIIVAINKIDKPAADVNRTMGELAEKFNLMPEEWGGDTIMVPISAKTGQNIEKLLDMILLTADVEELKADVNIPSEGIVIESHMETGKGSVVSLLVTGGSLKTGEFIVAGGVYGKVRTMLDWKGRPKGKATPSVPVTVTGFKNLPNFGDSFVEVADEKTARKMALVTTQQIAGEQVLSNVTSADLLRQMTQTDKTQAFSVIIKADTLGSVTSVVDSLKMIDTRGEVNFSVAHTGVGAINENDIYMAAGENIVVYGFNVDCPASIKKLAMRDGVTVRVYRVIYELLDDAKAEMEKLLPDEIVETDMGELVVRGVFRTERTEIIAGGEVLKGVVKAGYKAHVMRKKEVLGEVEVESLQKSKVTATELLEGETGGMALKTSKKILLEVGDRLKFFTREVRKKTL
jgi:translation initiation factor IF-2